MFAVEVYAAVRHFVFVEGNSRCEAAPGIRVEPRDSVEDVPVLAAAGLYAHEAGDEAEAWPFARGDRRDPGGGSHGYGEAAAHREADLRAAARRTRVRRWLHGGEGLRPHRAGKRPRDVRAADASARPCAGGFWRSGWRDRRCSLQAPLLLHGPAAVGCLLREGLSGRDDGGIPGRPRVGLRLLRRSAVVGAL